jgi:sigma-B regulation protein RsbU (phosphoserine phosphatase)
MTTVSGPALQIQNLKKVLAVNSRLNSTLNLSELLEIIMTTAAEVMRAKTASLLLVDEASQDLVFRVALGDKGGDLKEKFRVKMGEGIAGSVAKSGKSLIVNDTQNDPRFAKRFDDSTGFKTEAILCVPMTVKDKIIGVLQAINPIGRKAFDADDLELFETFSHQASLAVETARMHDEILKQERTKQELKIAHDIQQNFLPDLTNTAFPVDVAASNIPARDVSGDFYDVVPLGPHRTALMVGDVSGKGVPAALYMVRAISEYRFLAQRLAAPGELMTALNTTLAENSPFGMFVTLFYLVVDTQTRKIDYCSAGHHPLLRRSGKTGAVTPLDNAGGPPAGLALGVNYSQQSVTLESGDAVFVYTDGVTEARNPKREEYGVDRLVECLKTKMPDAKTYTQTVLENLKGFIQNAAPHDDITVLAAVLS